MSRLHTGLIVVVVGAVAIWGCSQGEQKTSSAHDKRIKALEAKCSELETSCQNLKQAHEEEKAKLEQEKCDLQKQLDVAKLVAKERDGLKTMLTVRTSERDAYHVQLDELRKGIRTLLSHVDAALPPCEDGSQKTSAGPRFE